MEGGAGKGCPLIQRPLFLLPASSICPLVQPLFPWSLRPGRTRPLPTHKLPGQLGQGLFFHAGYIATRLL